MRIPGRFFRRVWLKLALLVTLLLVIYELYTFLIVAECSDEDLQRSLAALCNLYERRLIAGDLCEPLCLTRQITYDTCLNYRHGKRIVNVLYQGENMVLKSKYSYLEQYNDISYVLDNKTHFPGIQDFNKMLIGTLKFNFDAKIPERRDMLTRLWTRPFHEVQDATEEKAAMRSIWSLVQQDEYLLYRYYDNVESFPRIKGSCGYYYAVESAPPGPILETKPLAVNDDTPWRPRRELALKFLDLIKDLQTSLEGRLHLCDMKADNFGLNIDGHLKVIDVDMAFFSNRLFEQFELETCRSDKDCQFIHCSGSCDMVKKTCMRTRKNSNLQTLCSQIFTHKLSTGYRGLLRYPPSLLEDSLGALLQECSNLDSSLPADRDEMAETLYWKLKNLLEKSLENFKFSDYVGL